MRWNDNDPVGSAARLHRAVANNHGRGFGKQGGGCLPAVLVAAVAGAGALVRIATRAAGLG